MQPLSLQNDFDRDGFAMVRGVFNGAESNKLLSALGPISSAGRRGMLGLPAVAELSHSARFLGIVRPHLPAEARPVRAIYFNKTSDTNWLVSWHQDLTLALRTRSEVPGFGPWSIKNGIPHVQAPIELLEKMVAVRIHLDDADGRNGALRVLPGSHRLGRLTAQQIERLREEDSEVICSASVGDVLLMRPLILHGSGRSTSTLPRRILHIEYASFSLPMGLEWHEVA